MEDVIKTIEQRINTKFAAVKRSESKETDEEGSEGLEEPLHEAGPSALRKTDA